MYVSERMSRGSGAANPYWSGDAVTYSGMHIRLRRTLGRACTFPCSKCERRALEWAYDHADPDEKVGVTLGREVMFSTKLEHYSPMCRSCHRKADGNGR